MRLIYHHTDSQPGCSLRNLFINPAGFLSFSWPRYTSSSQWRSDATWTEHTRYKTSSQKRACVLGIEWIIEKTKSGGNLGAFHVEEGGKICR